MNRCGISILKICLVSLGISKKKKKNNRRIRRRIVSCSARFFSEAPQVSSFPSAKVSKPNPSHSTTPLAVPLPSKPCPSRRHRRFLPLLAAFSGTLASIVAVTSFLHPSESDRLRGEARDALERLRGSLQKVLDRMVQNGAAAAVLWRSLVSVLSSANKEVFLGFELRVAELLADIAAAGAARRAAIAGAGGAAVVDWLLKSVGGRGCVIGVQSEAARALSYLLADADMAVVVLGRPHAVPYLLNFVLSFPPKK